MDEFLREMDSELVGWADPVQRLRTAIEKDEFELYCQPILALRGGEGYPLAEVLVRLREEEKTLAPPGEFLPVFEHYRMMPQLDRWVVRRAIKRLAQGSRIPRFTVNVHSQTLEDAEFPRFVAAQLRTEFLPPDSILFEIDESDAFARLGAASQFAAACRAIGAGVLVDGFGRRAASFAPIKELAVQFVKVDGSITRKLLTSEVARTKMNAMLRVSEALKFSLIAECVEEQDVLVRLKALGCGYAQGFGIYQPHPIASLAAS